MQPFFGTKTYKYSNLLHRVSSIGLLFAYILYTYAFVLLCTFVSLIQDMSAVSLVDSSDEGGFCCNTGVSIVKWPVDADFCAFSGV